MKIVDKKVDKTVDTLFFKVSKCLLFCLILVKIEDFGEIYIFENAKKCTKKCKNRQKSRQLDKTKIKVSTVLSTLKPLILLGLWPK